MADIKILTLNIRGLNNKHTYIAHLTRKYKPDFIFLQETNTQLEYKAKKAVSLMGLREGYFSLGRKPRGTAILQTSNRFSITHSYQDNSGRIVIIRTSSQKHTYTLVNIYAPAQKKEKHEFFGMLSDILHTQYAGENLIVGGDLNYIDSQLDKQNTNTEGPAPHVTIKTHDYLGGVIKAFRLVDAYREVEVTGRVTTFRDKAHQIETRIDRVYVPRACETKSVTHLVETLQYTDHKGVLVELLNPKLKKKKQKTPIWKLNNDLLNDPLYLKTIANLLKNIIHDSNTPHFKVTQIWTLIKSSIKQQSQILATLVNSKRKKEEERLKNLLTHEEDEAAKTHILTQLEELFNYQYKGAELRCKSKKITEGPNKLF